MHANDTGLQPVFTNTGDDKYYLILILILLFSFQVVGLCDENTATKYEEGCWNLIATCDQQKRLGFAALRTERHIWNVPQIHVSRGSPQSFVHNILNSSSFIFQ